MTKVAVIQTAFPGDVILATPVFEALKYRDRGWAIMAVARPESVCLLKNNPYIDGIIPFEKHGIDKGIAGLRKLASLLRGFDQAIIIQRHLRSALIPYLAGIPVRVGFDNSPARLFYSRKVKYHQDRHEVRRCLDLVGVDDSEKRFSPKIWIDDKTKAVAEEILLKNGISSTFIVVAPGSVWATKRYPYYSNVIDLVYEQFLMPVILMGGPGDMSLTRSIRDTSVMRLVDLAGQTDLLESAAIISKAKLVISNDSAPAHIAAAVGTPVVAIFGPTSPSFGFAPYSDRATVVEVGNIYCRPCTRHGSKRCPERHFECMKKLVPDQIIRAARSLLGG